MSIMVDDSSSNWNPGFHLGFLSFSETIMWRHVAVTPMTKHSKHHCCMRLLLLVIVSYIATVHHKDCEYG